MAGGSYNFTNKDSVVVQAEAYDRRVSFQQLVQTGEKDGMGGFIKTWQTVLSTFAHIEPWKGNESFTAQQVYPFMWVRVIIRYRPSFNIDASMQMTYGSRLYNVRSAFVPAEARRIIEMLCEELQAPGTLH